MTFNLKLWHKVVILLAVPLAFELCFIAVLLNLLNQVEMQARVLNHSKAVIACADDLRRITDQAVNALFLYVTTSSTESRQTFGAAIEELPKESARLKELIKDDPSQRAICSRLEPLQTEDLQILREVQTRIDNNDSLSGFSAMGMLRKKARKISESSLALLEITKLEKAEGCDRRGGRETTPAAEAILDRWCNLQCFNSGIAWCLLRFWNDPAVGCADGQHCLSFQQTAAATQAWWQR